MDINKRSGENDKRRAMRSVDQNSVVKDQNIASR